LLSCSRHSPPFYGPGRSITVSTRPRQWTCLSIWIQSKHCFFNIHYIIIHPHSWHLLSDLFHSDIQSTVLFAFLIFLDLIVLIFAEEYKLNRFCENSNEPSECIKGGEFLDYLSDYQLKEESAPSHLVQIIKSLAVYISTHLLLPLSEVQTFSSVPYSRTLSNFVLPSWRETKFHTHIKQKRFWNSNGNKSALKCKQLSLFMEYPSFQI